MGQKKSKLSKRRAVSQTLSNVNEVTNFEDHFETFQLGDMVLQNIIARETNSYRNFTREQVNKRFAKILRSYYDATQFELRFGHRGLGIPYIFVDLASFRHRRRGRSRKRFQVDTECDSTLKLSSVLEQIFVRIKRFRCLSISTDRCRMISETIVEIFQHSQDYKSMQFDRLEFFDSLSPFNYESAITKFIKVASSRLKQLRFELKMPTTAAESKQFWAAVAGCINLQKLSIEPRATSDEFQKRYLQDCLKSLKITKFEFNDFWMESGRFDAQWLADALGGNESLRKISLMSTIGEQLDVYLTNAWDGFACPVIQPILARVRYFDLRLCPNFCFYPDHYLANIDGILRSLPENCCVFVRRTMDNLFIDLDHEQLLNFVKTWLHRMMLVSRTIKLRLSHLYGFQMIMMAIDKVLDSIASAPQYSELKIERLSDSAQLIYRNTKLVITSTSPSDKLIVVYRFIVTVFD